MNTIKIYGLPRSGTNLLEWLLAKNYHVTVWNSKTGGSKHALYCPAALPQRPDALIVNVKDPLAWMVSVWRRYGKHKPFAKFLRQEFSFSDSEKTYVFFDTPASAWNNMHKHWLSICNPRPLVVRYEDVITSADAETRMCVLARELGFERTPDRFSFPTNKMGGGQTLKQFPFDATYYQNHEYLKEYRPKDLEYARARLAPALMERFEYAA